MLVASKVDLWAMWKDVQWVGQRGSRGEMLADERAVRKALILAVSMVGLLAV